MKKKLIITGCNGQLGRAINKELAPHSEYELVTHIVCGDNVSF